MGGLSIPINIAVKRFSDKISFIQPIIEAITNSLEANAKNITIKIALDEIVDLNDNHQFKIKEYLIEDDGEGFTQANISSFLTYMSDFKFKFGCKGVGRITWLKVFDKVKVESYCNNQKIYFDFDLLFDESKINYENLKEPVSNKTIIKFINVNKNFYADGKYDYKLDGNLQNLRDLIEENLLIKLSLLKSTNTDFNINFESSNGEIVEPISHNSIHELKQKSFIINTDTESYHFDIYYSFSDNNKKINSAYFCANGRTVKEIPTKIVSNILPQKMSSILLVTSNYLDNHVNNERNEFDIIDKGNLGILSWETINESLANKIEEILVTEFPNFKDDNEKNINELIDEYPYLSKYIKEDNSLIKNKDRILVESKKKFEKDKTQVSNKFRKLLEDNKINSEEFDNVVHSISEISARELAEYIVYRQQIIEALRKISNESDKSEKKLHELFIEKGKESKKSEHNIYDNNLWLFDDKFMSYVYAASDKEIKAITNALNEEDTQDKYRPDIALFYSHGQDNKNRDAILVEFKACGANLNEKMKAPWEINRNALVIREVIPNINRLWCFCITQFTDKVIKGLKSQDFKPLFSNQENQDIFYRYYVNNDAHCYYLSIESLIEDADTRNNLFINIIKQK